MIFRGNQIKSLSVKKIHFASSKVPIVMALCCAGYTVLLSAYITYILIALPASRVSLILDFWIEALLWGTFIFSGITIILSIVIYLISNLLDKKLLNISSQIAKPITISISASIFAIVATSLLVSGLIRKYDIGRELCLSHLMHLTKAVSLYCVDNDNRFPLVTKWCDSINRYINDEDFVCIESPDLDSSYAINSFLNKAYLNTLENPRSIVVIFESDYGWNANGGSDLLPTYPRHQIGDHYSFADGHAKWIPRKKLPDGSWAKEPAAADWVIWEPVLKKPAENNDDLLHTK